MHWLLRILAVPVATLGLVAGGSALYAPAMLAPQIETPYSDLPNVPEADSLDDLYAMRDRLMAKLEEPVAKQKLISQGIFSTPTELLQQLQAVEIRIQVEETGKENWQAAQELATQGLELSQQPNPTTETYQRIYEAWQAAVDALGEIPEGSFHYDAAAQKMGDYTAHLEKASYNYDTARSDFLIPIAESTLGQSRVHITVCHVETGECRRLNGNQPPASPASLIKLPIGIAVVQKIVDENIDLDRPMLVERSNYTEDASDIRAGVEYPLRKVLRRMINDSSNIATNQLIDFAGLGYINQVLDERGYTATHVGHKLVGESTYPSNFGASGTNRTTTDELTDMMVKIYNFEHPGDDILLDSLVEQWDWKLGYAGLKGLPDTFWIGEKTGQNSKVLGTTVAAKIEDQRYVISITIDHSAWEGAIRDMVRAIAQHIIEHDGF
ncbi:MAG: serine hydrolase [Elainellaceae cyanobacterium]